MRNKFAFFTLFIILVTGLILRVYKITDNFYFSGELGKEMLYIKHYADTHSFPLSGMATSHEWLNYGPVYYWIMIPIYLLISKSPFILFWSALVIAMSGLVVNYFVVKKIANRQIALASTFLMSVSPLLIWQTRLSKLHVFFWLLIPVWMLFMYYLWEGKKKWVLPAGIIFGLLFSFHFSQLPLLGVIALLFYFKKNVYKVQDYLKFILGLIIPNITYIAGNLNLALWIPYRILNLESKNPEGSIQSITEYFGKSIFLESNLSLIAFFTVLILFIHFIYKNKSNIKKDFFPFFIISSIGMVLVANVLHGAPPVHYFLPIFTITPILIAYYLVKFKYWPAVILILLVINLFSFSVSPLFYGKFPSRVAGSDLTNYKTLTSVADHVVTDADGRVFAIKRIGPFDYFPENYSQNYKYLIYLKGGKLTQNSTNVYTIIETDTNVNVQK